MLVFHPVLVELLEVQEVEVVEDLQDLLFRGDVLEAVENSGFVQVKEEVVGDIDSAAGEEVEVLLPLTLLQEFACLFIVFQAEEVQVFQAQSPGSSEVGAGIFPLKPNVDPSLAFLLVIESLPLLIQSLEQLQTLPLVLSLEFDLLVGQLMKGVEGPEDLNYLQKVR